MEANFGMRLNRESRHRWFVTAYLTKTLSSSALVCFIEETSESISCPPPNSPLHPFIIPVNFMSFITPSLNLPGTSKLSTLVHCQSFVHVQTISGWPQLSLPIRKKRCKFHYQYIFFTATSTNQVKYLQTNVPACVTVF